MQSKIATYIRNNTTWREDFKSLSIHISEDDHFIIFNYDAGCDFSNELVQEARGIILDKETLEVACWPFRKFANSHEPYADDIDWATARVQSKLDGSICKVWFNKYTQQWQWSSNSIIDARNCNISPLVKSFYDAITKTDNYKDIAFEALDKDRTYIFELVGPYNKVVINYDTPHLYHIGTRSNSTGAEYNCYIPTRPGADWISKPEEYPLHSFNECIAAVETLNKTDVVEHEGFVVVDANWHRIKIKSPEYLFYHHLRTGVLSKSNAIKFLQSDDVDIENLINNFPEYEDMIHFYQSEIKRVEDEITEIVTKVRAEYDGDRRAIAAKYKTNKYSCFIFWGLDDFNRTTKELIAHCLFSSYLNYIRDYTEVN